MNTSTSPRSPHFTANEVFYLNDQHNKRIRLFSSVKVMSSPSLITFLAHAPSSRTSGSRSIAGRCRRGRARGSSQVGNAEVRRNDVAGPCGRSACEPRLAETFNPAAAADVPHGPGAASLERGASQGAAAARLFPGRCGCAGAAPFASSPAGAARSRCDGNAGS